VKVRVEGSAESTRSEAVSIAARIALDMTELPPTLSVERAGRLLGLSRSSAYRAAASGQLPTLAFGRRLVVPTFRLLEMLGLADGGQR
jgi:hypothetical protein